MIRHLNLGHSENSSYIYIMYILIIIVFSLRTTHFDYIRGWEIDPFFVYYELLSKKGNSVSTELNIKIFNYYLGQYLWVTIKQKSNETQTA